MCTNNGQVCTGLYESQQVWTLHKLPAAAAAAAARLFVLCTVQPDVREVIKMIFNNRNLPDATGSCVL